MIVTSIDTLTSLIGGFTIFAILGNLAHNLGIENIADVVKSGTGLAFIRLYLKQIDLKIASNFVFYFYNSYPDAISKFDFLPQVMVIDPT